MVTLANRVKHTITAVAGGGTGALTLGPASTGFQTLADAAGVADGATLRYTIENASGGDWELGSGVYTASGTTLTRTPTESSNSGNAITATTDSTVFITAAAADLGPVVYATINDLTAATGMVVGDIAMVNATKKLYMYTTTGWWFIATLTNTAPTAITGASTSYALATDGTATTVTLTSTDPEGFPITFSHTVTSGSLGSAATVSQNNNVFTITPSTNSAHEGSFSLTFSASDGNSVSQAVSSFTLSFGYDLANGSYDSKSFYVGSEEGHPRSVTFNPAGTRMFIAGVNQDTVFRYNLSTAYDVSTASRSMPYSAHTFNPTESSNNIMKVLFNANGTMMYLMDTKLWEYSLSTGFQVNTASYTNNNLAVTGATGAAFSADGTRLFILFNNTDSIKQYNLSTGFDLSTISDSGNSFSLSTQTTSCEGLDVNSAGTKIFVVGGSSGKVYEYSASGGWDASTISYSGIYDIGTDLGKSNSGSIHDITFSATGHKMYIVGQTYDTVYQFSASS